MKLVCRGDIDGFFAIALDNLVQLLLVTTLCLGVVGMSPALVFGRILPGVAVSYLFGNLFYAWQAHRLARREGRDDVCAMPYGLNTPTMIAYAFLVMAPAKAIAQAQGAADPDTAAWQAGLVACLGSGLIETGGALIADFLRRMTPRAALLASLAGAGIAFLTLNFSFLTFAHPIVGLATLGLVLVFYLGGAKPRGGIPAALVVLAVGIGLSWMTGIAPVGTRPHPAWSWHWPLPVAAELWAGFRAGRFWPYLSVVVPMGLLDLLASLQCIESAKAAGDDYGVPSSLAANGIGTLVAALFGSPFPTSIYIGHPAWKRMGSRAGYSTLNGAFITAICLSGCLITVAWAVPIDAGLAIIVWIGIIIAVQAFEATPQAHWPAVVVGILPVILAWTTFTVTDALRLAGAGSAISAAGLARFHAAGLYLDGGFALEQGTFYCALILSAVAVFAIERRYFTAAAWAFAASLLSLVSLLHAWKFSGGDTVGILPLLDRVDGSPDRGPLFPALGYAAGYAALGLALVLARWLTAPEAAEKPG